MNAVTKDVFLPNREKFFTSMTKFLTKNKSGYLVGESLTWADLYLAEMAEFNKKVPTLYDGFPEVKAHSEKVRSIPALKKWIETRPETKF
ncbi:GST C-terminal domain-containing protein [Trichostrongylus colubriformis]|uniref:GST C-terminal domain-containing protein n=1 Tax=Trichostrongylus colubriformis TaxID=6319 RepID=A0AAN8G3M8_TRICO